MKKIFSYPNIDMVESGKKMRRLAEQSGFTVKQIQEYLMLSCPQPIYRWFKGQIFPSLENAYALSRLFHVHMEELFVLKAPVLLLDIDTLQMSAGINRGRLYAYYINFFGDRGSEFQGYCGKAG